MVYKSKIILFKILCIVFVFIFSNAFSKIIYYKNDISISELELQKFSDLYFKNNNNSSNQKKALKELILQKKLINRLTKNKIEVINKIDEIIIFEYGNKIMTDATTLNFLRFMKIKNEFIVNYFTNQFTITGLIEVLDKFDNLILPVSTNGCLTIIDKIEFKNNFDFATILLDHLKNRQKKLNININQINYEICLNIQNLKLIENQIALYIEDKTSYSFENFIHGK